MSWLQLLAKEAIHRFKRNALGLGKEEEDEDDGAEHERGKEEVNTKTHTCEHLLREAGNKEIEEPASYAVSNLSLFHGELNEQLT